MNEAAVQKAQNPPRYDFKRPPKFSKEQTRTVSIIHETFARLATTTLSGLLGRIARVACASVDQCTYDEFIRSIPNPTCLGIFGMEPLRGQAIIEIDPAVSYSLMEVFFGGDAAGAFSAEASNHSLTDAESSVMGYVVSRLMDPLALAWAQVIDMKPRVKTIESNPLFAQIIPPNEMVILVSLRVKVGDREGMMNIVFPYLTIEPITKKLVAQYWYSSVRRPKDGSSLREGFKRLSGIPVETELCAEGPRLSLRDLGGLERGILIPLKGYEKGAAFLRMGGAPVLRLEALDMRGGKSATYRVISRIGEQKKVDGGADGEVGDKDKDKEPRMEAMLQKIAADFQAGIAQSLSEIRQGIGELKARQERLEEGIAMGQGAVMEELPAATLEDAPFACFSALPPEITASIIQKEHPQLIAFVLSRLDPKAASAVLGALDADAQADAAARIARMGRSRPDIVADAEGVFKNTVEALPKNEAMSSGGLDRIIDILNLADRSVEKNVVDAMTISDPALAEEIKSNMFVFEDIVMIDAKQVGLVLARVDRDTLLKAMKAIPNEVRDFLWGCVGEEKRIALKETFEGMGRVRLHDVEDAQQKIVALIREMDENGEIVVARPEEMAN